MRLKILAGASFTAALVAVTAGPAFAHVTTNPAAAPQGGEITLGFRVPNEQTNTNVVKVDIVLPTDHPLLGVAVEPLPGWTPTVTEVKLNPAVQTDDGPVAQAVSEIVWAAAAGGGTAPGQYQEFHVLVQRLPTDVAQVAFKAVQTYGDGTVVRWIDPIDTAHPSPDHPTPILALTPAAGDATSPTTVQGTVPAGPAAAAVDTSKLAKKTSVDGAQALAVTGIVVGALGLVLAVVALARRPRATAGPGASEQPG